MTNQRDHRSSGASRTALVGAVGGVLVGAGALIGPSTDGPPITDAQAAAATYVDEAPAILTAAVIGLLGAAALVWFAGVVREWLGSRTPVGSPLPSIAFGGAIGGAVSLVFSGVIVVSQALRAQDATVDPDVLAAMDDLSTLAFGAAAPLCFSAMVGAVAIASIRNDTEVGRPLAFASIVLAALMLVVPIAFIGMLLFLPWLLAVSIMIAVREPKTTDTTSLRRERVTL